MVVYALLNESILLAAFKYSICYGGNLTLCYTILGSTTLARKHIWPKTYLR